MHDDYVRVTWCNGNIQVMSAAAFHILMSAKSTLCCERRILKVEQA